MTSKRKKMRQEKQKKRGEETAKAKIVKPKNSRNFAFCAYTNFAS